MSHLNTNVIALPAPAKSIQWRSYKCSYSTSDAATDPPPFLSVCRDLLKAKVPCLWRPLCSSDTASHILGLLHLSGHEGATGGSEHSGPEGNSEARRLQIPDCWEIWVFHTVIPMEKAVELVPIPSSFESVSSGEISWSSGLKTIEVKDHTGNESEQQLVGSIDELFDRALYNVMDCALLPLSIVRFGLSQWISLSGLTAEQDQNQLGHSFEVPDNTVASHPSINAPQLPPTPPSTDLDLPPGTAEFLAANAILDEGKFPASAPKLQSNCMKTQDQQRPSQTQKTNDHGLLHLLKLSATFASSQSTLLLQYNSVLIRGFRPMAYLDTILDRRRPGGDRRVVTDCIPSSSETPSGLSQLSPLAAVRIAPLGIHAMLMSVPTTSLGDTEDKAIDAWSTALGYPVDFFAKEEGAFAYGASRLAWIALSKDSEPMLYPQRLVLIDEKLSLALDSSLGTLPESKGSELAVVAATVHDGLDEKVNNSSPRSPVGMDVDQPSVPAQGTAEEGEDEEGEYDEEGEIAESVASEQSSPSDTKVPPATAELDAIVSTLQRDVPEPLEVSLVDIQRSMAKFQSEIRAKEEAEEEMRQNETAEKNAAASIATAKGASSLTKSTSAKSSSSVGVSGTKKRQRSNSKHEQSNKARRKSAASETVPRPMSTISDSSNEDIPLQALVASTSANPTEDSATQPLTQQTDLGAGENATSNDAANASGGDIGSLFGDTGMAEDGSGGLDGNVVNIGDDMGLGMGLGMDMGIGDNLGDFASSMFGVTDDDFNFFDTVPPQQPKPENPAMDMFSQPEMDTANSMDVDINPQGAFDMEMRSEEPKALTKTLEPTDSEQTGAVEQHQPMQDMDDLFDDGMFDSFFGGQTTSASAIKEAPIASTMVKQEDNTATATSTNIYATQDISNSGSGAAALNMDVKTSLAGQSLSSPPGVTTTVSLTSTHSTSPVDSMPKPPLLAATSTMATTASATAADMATPASLKMTPAPSIVDFQTPTPTMQSLNNSKGGDSADEHSLGQLATADNSPATLTSNNPGSLPAHSTIAQSVIPEESEAVYSTGSTLNVPTSLSVIPARATQSQIVPGGSKSIGGAVKASFASSKALIPDHYGFISTPYDDVIKSGRSWLHDTPTPASVSDAGNPHETIDPHELQRSVYIEKSLNPVAWLKRVSARHIQKYQMNEKAHSRKPLTSAALPSSVPRYGLASLPSIRKLRGWLASYKAKAMYTKHVIPRHVLAYQRMENDGGAGTSSEMDSAIRSYAATHVKTEHGIPDAIGEKDNSHRRQPSDQHSLLPGTSEAMKSEPVSNLQYPAVSRVDVSRGADGLPESMTLLNSSGKQQSAHHSSASLPSFTNIINPRKPRKASVTQMPGSMLPSLNMGDLQNAAASVIRLGGAASGQDFTINLPKQAVVRVNAIESSWVPIWILVSKGVVDTLVGSEQAYWFKWADSLHKLVYATKAPLMQVSGGDLVRFADIPVVSSFLKAFLPNNAAVPAAGNTGVSNLGARIGGLLMLGPDRQTKAIGVLGENADANNADSSKSVFRDSDTATPGRYGVQIDAATRNAFSGWLKQLSQDRNWINTVQMLADWAVGSSLLLCTQSDFILDNQTDETPSRGLQCAEDIPVVGTAVSRALLSFWRQGTADDHHPADLRIEGDFKTGSSNSSVEGLLTLSKLLALGNTVSSSTSKYRGFTVKKRRTVPQPSGIYGNSGNNSRHAGSNNVTGGGANPTPSMPLASSGNADGSASSTATLSSPYAGSVVVPSGSSVIEPLLDVRILVGSHGQEDVAVPSSGASALKSRDAESIYIKRWRYAQKLASRATHDARVATGEIEETEEGEEREDGEDEKAENTQTDPVEDWPDPDGNMMEAEDALRRVCISTNPVSLRWWSQLQMRPIGASKDVRWVAFIPPLLHASSPRLAGSSDQQSPLPPTASHRDEGIEEEEEELTEQTSSDVREWCQRSSDVAQWYIGDVDSAYQAQHLGVHRPLGLQKVLEGTFTQLTESVLPTESRSSADSLEWSARLKHEAERLGYCMAHGWYTSSQLEQQKQSQDAADDTPLPMASSVGSGATNPLSATTLVLYMLVPHSSLMVTWLAMSEASTIALRSFEKTLGSLIARTSLGVPSSTTTVSSQVPWPAVVVHPLPLDLMSLWYSGGRPRAVPSAQETAMSVYNRCPEFLSPVPSILVASPAASHYSQASTAPFGGEAVGTDTVCASKAISPVSPLLSQSQPQSQGKDESYNDSSVHGAFEKKQEVGRFMAAIAACSVPGNSAAAAAATTTTAQGSMLYQQRHAANMTSRPLVSKDCGSSSGGADGQLLTRHSGYFIRTPSHRTSNSSSSSGGGGGGGGSSQSSARAANKGGNNRAANDNTSDNNGSGRSNLGMAAFAHRAYIISMPCTFPSYNSEQSKDSAFVPATISLSRMNRQNIVLDDPLSLVHDASNSNNSIGAHHQTSMTPGNTSSSLGSPQQRSTTYPTPTQSRFAVSNLTAEEDGYHYSQGQQVTAGGGSGGGSGPLAAPPSSKLGDEVSCELDEVCVSFSSATRNTLDPASSRKKRTAAALSSASDAATSGGGGGGSSALCSSLINHPLRPSDQISTLHCVYCVFGTHSRWVAVCWCDERGEYVEHDVFCDSQPIQRDLDEYGDSSTMLSASAAARIWAGCLRYQKLFCGSQTLRVVLGQWQGMSQAQALAWQEYAGAWNASRSPATALAQPDAVPQTNGVLLHTVSIGINPAQGLHLSSSRNRNSSAKRLSSNDKGNGNSSGGDSGSHGMSVVDSTTLANRQFSVVLHGQQPCFEYRRRFSAKLLDEPLALPSTNAAAELLWTTGYMVLQDHHACAAPEIPCLCVQQLLLTNADSHAADRKGDARKMSLLTTRTILKQYHQLAVLRHAERDFAASRNGGPNAPSAAAADAGGCWPANLLPLPVAVIHDIRNALACLL